MRGLRAASVRDWEGKFVVYRYFDGTGRLLYVGATKNVAKRDAEHRAGGTGAFWYPLVARMRIQVFPTRQAAEDAEREAIRSEAPTYNLRLADGHISDRAHWTKDDHRLLRRWHRRVGNRRDWWKAVPA